MPYFLNKSNVGISLVSSQGDGSTMMLKWWRAFPTTISNKIAYNIYMDINNPIFETDFFNKSPAFVSVDGTLQVSIPELTPGQEYWFAVRPVEYNVTQFDLHNLPSTFNGLRVYPETRLRSNITAAATTIPVLSVSEFPSTGILKIGAELIQYSSLDAVNNNFLLTSAALQRGFNGTSPAIHDIDGYDGYTFWDGSILFYPIDIEDQNTVVFSNQSHFDVDHYAFTLADGYRQATKDIVNADLNASDVVNTGFPAYDYAGWHRTDPVALFNGECVGSYFGGELFCADGYDGVGRVLRGISVQDVNNMRQEVLLSIDGEPCVLVKKQWTGIRCFCILANQEFPDARCKKCYGTGFVVGWSQYFDSRNSDGKIRLRFEPWVDDLPLVEAGLDPEGVAPGAWTLVLPAIHKRDFLVRFDQDGNEEFRYEIIKVTRNRLLNQNFGAQKLALQRIRKTDIIYQVPIFKDTSMFPTILNTSSTASLGIPAHTHTIVANELLPSKWNQITSISQGHSHALIFDSLTGIPTLSTELGHTHSLIY